MFPCLCWKLAINSGRNMYFLSKSKIWCFSSVFCVVFLTVFDVVLMQVDSPCPYIFEYALDENQRLFGRIRVENPKGSNVVLNVELSVGNSVQGYNGNIELAYPRAKAVDEIVSGRPLNYHVFFPAWRVFPPKITKILVNGELICFGPPLDIKRVPVLTTINLQHTLKINSLNLAAADGSSDSAASNDHNRPGSFHHEPAKNPFTNVNNINQNQPQSFELPKKDTNTFFFQLGSMLPTSNQQYPNNPFFAIPTTEKSPENSFFNIFATEKSQGNSFLNFIPAIGNTQENPFFAVAPTTEKSPVNSFFGIPGNLATTEKPKSKPITIATPPPKIPDEPPPFDVRDNLNDICGKSLSTNSLIGNGIPVIRGYYPWLVALYTIKHLNLEFTCGGSLVSTKHVVTAAHCLRPYEKRVDIDQLLIILGKYNIQRWTNDKDSLMLSAHTVTVHPDYRALSADADLAVITLSQEVKLKKFIRPICLWSEGTDLKDVVGQSGIVAGWGKDEKGAILSPEPKQVTLPIVSQVECLRSHDDFNDVTSERTFCAGYRNGSGPCNGDSGGGFMMQRNGRWILRGVVSMSIADQTRKCDLTQYLVFTDVSKFSGWLSAIIKQ